MLLSLLMRSTLIAASLLFALPACSQPADERDPLAPLPADVQRSELAVPPTPTGTLSWAAYKDHLRARAIAEGIRPATVDAVLPGLRPSNRAIELDRSQPGGSPGSTSIPPYAPYRAKHVTRDIITRGKAEARQHWDQLHWVQERYGVDKDVILAIYGKETSYGRITGNFDLFEALGALAWEGRRRDLFEGEFMAALKLLDRGYSRGHLKGSWAGAAGKTQFMPTNILTLAADGDGDNFADIWNSEPDAFASIGNYLASKGWIRGIDWGIPVRVPANFDRNSVRRLTEPERCPAVFNRHSRWLTMAEWRARGIGPTDTSFSDGVELKLFEPDGPGNTAYLLTHNYDMILDYNCSNFYALTIGLVADAIER